MAIFGTVRDHDQPHIGKVWMLGTTELYKHKRWVIQNSKPILESLFDGYAVLWNFIDERQSRHIRWLKWLGFDIIGREQRYGHEGLPFLQFAKVA